MSGRIKVNWFSPVPPADTGIALYSQAVVEALATCADVTVWTDQKEWDGRLERTVPVRRFDPAHPNLSQWNGADATFYNIGNNRHFHQGIWEISRRNAGIVILHDTALQHLFADLYLNEWKSPDEYCRIMAHYYGRSGRQAARSFLEGKLPIDQLSVDYPLTPLALENAVAAVIHNRAGLPGLRELPLPVACVPLAYAPLTGHTESLRLERTGQPPYRLITFGFIGPNRRLDSLLEAWARLAERDQFRLRICGRLWDPEHITSRIRELGLQDLTEVCGYLSDDALHAALASADLAINLRYPTMGEASLSQLLIWEHALPSLITRTGWYATVSPETAVFIRPEHEIPDICLQLRAFLQNPDYFAAMGRHGYELLHRDHTPRGYAEFLIRLAAGLPDWHLRSVNLRLAGRAGDDMRGWITPEASDPLTSRVARAVWELGGYRSSAAHAGS